MALSVLVPFGDVVPVIPGTGIQFLDFGFNVDRNSPAPRDWGFFDPRTALNDGKVPVCVRRGDEEAKGVESYSVDLKSIVEMFERQWVPLPMLRREPGGFFRGPTNWARAYLVKLDTPDEAGNTFRLLVAMDTALMDFVESEAYLAPSRADAQAGRQFEIPGHKAPLDWFFAEEWVRDWCLELFRAMLERDERRRRKLPATRAVEISDADLHEQMQGSNEHLARYRALVDLIASLDLVPPVTIEDRFTEPVRPAIDFDLVIDLGNSRTCGLLVESSLETLGADITKAVKLQLRDLSCPEQVYSDPFPSRVEFARASFGKDHHSIRSGRADAFNWPTVVRVGDEALRLAAQRPGWDGHSGLSSPKRYLWDDDPQADVWRFNDARPGAQAGDAVGVAFTTLVNNFGEALHRLDSLLVSQMPDRGFPALRPIYARRNLTSFALAEVLVQAIAMANSAGHRMRRPANARLPRRLKRMILTMPTAMPLVERNALRQQAEAACELAYLSLGQARLDYDEEGNPKLAFAGSDPRPEVVLKWDEATATQAVYLYSQVALNYSGDARSFFQDVQHPNNAHDPAMRDQLRLATIDLGGGTTDLMITSIRVDGRGANVTLTPRQDFREGFNVAGDDALFKVVSEFVVKGLREKLAAHGLGDRAELALAYLLGGDHGEITAARIALRQQFATQIAAPIGLGILAEYERFDPLAAVPALRRPFASFFAEGNAPPDELLARFNAELERAGAKDFRVQDLEFVIDLADVDRAVRSVFQEMLQALGEMVYRYRADMLILSGRTSRLPAVHALLEESASLPGHRILRLHQFKVGPWYPFPDLRGMVGDPKTTAAVGAMICLLGNGQLQNFNYRSDALLPRNTARFFGKLDKHNRIPKEDEFIDDLDLDNPDYSPKEKYFEFRGPMALGFRQLAAQWWPGTRQYAIDYRTTADATELNLRTPLSVCLKVTTTGKRRDAETDAFVLENTGLDIHQVRGREGRNVPSSRLRMRLQTLNDQRGYWLDTGILMGG